MLVALGGQDVGERSQDEIRIFGEPFHAEPEALVARYRQQSLDEFLADEARRSVGNYVLVARSAARCRIIASPGYCGGYWRSGDDETVVSTTLAPALSGLKDRVGIDPFGICLLLSDAPESSFQQLPISTIFQGVRKIPPATLMEFDGAKLVANSCYLMTARTLPPCASFEQSLNEAMDAYAAYYRKQQAPAAMLFSGGVDSLVIYLALRERMDPKDIRVFTMDHSLHNGLERAGPVARHLGFEISPLSYESMNSDQSIGYLLDLMRKDTPSLGGPHIGFVQDPAGSPQILHGQNMDAMCNTNMTVLHVNLEDGYLTPRAMASKDPAHELKQYKTFIGNTQFTDAYLANITFQRTTMDFFRKKYPRTIADPSPGKEGIFRGMLSSQHPNLLMKPTHPADQIEALDREYSIVRGMLPPGKLSNSTIVDIIRYLSYSHLANKRATTFALPDGGRPSFVAMSGPIASYFVGKPRNLSHASRPKQEIYALARKATGMHYNALAANPDGAIVQGYLHEEKPDRLLCENLKYLRSDDSRVIAGIKDQTIRDHVSKIYDKTHAAIRDGEVAGRRHHRKIGRSILNMELLLEAAQG